LVAKKIAKDKNLSGYKLIVNVGREGGQLVDHLHLHLLSPDVAN
jgi:histidine triad (HIT) family protein